MSRCTPCSRRCSGSGWTAARPACGWTWRTGLYKDPDLPDDPDPDHDYRPLNAPSAYTTGPRSTSCSGPGGPSWTPIRRTGSPARRTAIGEVWYDAPGTLRPYLAPDGLPQVFNFQLIVASWDVAGFRARDRRGAGAGRRLPRAVGHRQPRRAPAGEPLPAGRGLRPADDQPAGEPGPHPPRDRRPPGPGRGPAAARPARVGLHLPGRGAGPARGHGPARGRAAGPAVPPHRRPVRSAATAAGCRCPGPGPARTSASPRPPRPRRPGSPSRRTGAATASRRSSADPDSFLSLYRTALRLRREHPALGRGTLRWLDGPRRGRRPALLRQGAGLRLRREPRPGRRRRSRRTARSCWPASRTRSAPTGTCGPIRRCGCPPDATDTASNDPSSLEAMPKVRVPRKNVTPNELVTVLSHRLGAGYRCRSTARAASPSARTR